MVGTNKSLGQHWLKNRELLNEIADLAANSGADQNSEITEVCIEIGPGLGTLTSSLLKRFQKVIAVEYDKRLAGNLPKSFPGKNLEVINDDILKYDFNSIKEPYVVAGNIPYYITSPIIEKLLNLKNAPKRIVLLIQKEVAERILSETETMLSLFVKNHARVSRGPFVHKSEFTPPPKVDSEVIVLEPRSATIDESVFELIKIGFKAPRKKLIHNLSGLKPKHDLEDIFKALDISLDARPGNLDLKTWQKLYNAIKV